MQIVFTSLFLFFAILTTAKSAIFNNFTTVSELDLEKYQGHWFQVYASPFDYTFQGYGKCITADYGILGPNNVSVLNSQLNRNGDLEQISGYAFYKDVTKPGQISVTLEGVPVVAPYWVLNLGEVKNSQYQYSIISVPEGPSLWVLSRNVVRFFTTYNDEVTKLLDGYGFKYVIVDQFTC
jgi:lipocalin